MMWDKASPGSLKLLSLSSQQQILGIFNMIAIDLLINLGVVHTV